eukprot:1179795-Prorocentrum_minimum.AAC.12
MSGKVCRHANTRSSSTGGEFTSAILLALSTFYQAKLLSLHAECSKSPFLGPLCFNVPVVTCDIVTCVARVSEPDTGKIHVVRV